MYLYELKRIERSFFSQSLKIIFILVCDVSLIDWLKQDSLLFTKYIYVRIKNYLKNGLNVFFSANHSQV